MKRLIPWILKFQAFADRKWYPAFIGFLAALDNLVLIIPNDGILISSSMATPKRWFTLALNVSIGSTIGGVILAVFAQKLGLPWILELWPLINQSLAWVWTETFFDQYGLIVVFAVAITPLAQQPAVLLAALAGTHLETLAIIIFVGRFIKFLIMSYVGSHAPKYLSRMWGLQGELKEVGISKENLPKT